MRDFRSRKAWSEYHAQVQKGFPYNGTACYKLDDGYGGERMINRPGASAFFPYWAALELIKEGKGESINCTFEELLDKCKENYEYDIKYRAMFTPTPDTYKGYPLEWECFRPMDERFNDPGYGHETQICTLPFRATESDVTGKYFSRNFGILFS